jgi:CDP-diacylglycerol--serine O-phosphatidyltransferase
MEIRKPINHIALYKLIPSMVTLFSICLGITAVRYALDYKWTIAATLILVACVMDGIDGRLARMLDASSKFGAELDSQADMVSFGVSPAVVMYLWSLHEIPYKGVGWACVLFFIACSAIRLARFNAMLDDTTKKNNSSFFTGVPMPSAASLAIFPMVLTFELLPFDIHPAFVAVNMILVGLLMISRIPTFSLKDLKIQKQYVPIAMVIAAVLIAGIIMEPWVVLPFVAIVYLISIPIIYYRTKNAEK